MSEIFIAMGAYTDQLPPASLREALRAWPLGAASKNVHHRWRHRPFFASRAIKIWHLRSRFFHSLLWVR
jgi:hypothetical protein